MTLRARVPSKNCVCVRALKAKAGFHQNCGQEGRWSMRMSAGLTGSCLRGFIRRIRTRSGEMPSRTLESVFFASSDGWNVSHKIDPI